MRRAMNSDRRRPSVAPRFVPEQEYMRVCAELKKQVAAGKVSQKDADRRITEMQIANTKAHIEAGVKSGETTRAEADKLYRELGYR